MEPTQAHNEKGYWRKPENYISLATLLVVLTYTGVQIIQTFLIRTNNIISERAFVSSQVAGLLVGMTTDKIPTLGVFISLENTGGSPTKNLSSKLVCEPSITTAIEPWDFIKQHKIETTPIFIGARSHGIAMCSFTMDQIKQMSTGMLHGYVVGEIIYYDRIDPSVQHRTHYAYELNYPAIDPNTNAVHTLTTDVGKHNCADEECPE
jgi:hypothetical protein